MEQQLRQRLRSAFLARAEAGSQLLHSRDLPAVLTAAGWNLTSFATGQGTVRVKGATQHDALACLAAAGFADRAVASAEGVQVALQQVEPWFLRNMAGSKGIENPMLVRAVVAGEHGPAPP